MHTLKNWTAKRSGPTITVSGLEQGKPAKYTVLRIVGPDPSRMALPRDVVGWMKDGTPVALI